MGSAAEPVAMSESSVPMGTPIFGSTTGTRTDVILQYSCTSYYVVPAQLTAEPPRPVCAPHAHAPTVTVTVTPTPLRNFTLHPLHGGRHDEGHPHVADRGPVLARELHAQQP